MAYADWGDPDNPRAILCVHGLSRNGRDFDYLAQSLSDEYRVVCPDIVGRGKSQWLDNKADYNYHVYQSDMAALIARMDVASLDWIGTSMGGLIGMMIAARRNSPIRRLVINDIGPFIPLNALQRIGEFLGLDPSFPTFEDFTNHLSVISATFGPLTKEQWRHLARHSAIERADSTWGFRYDPGIAETFRVGASQSIDLWPLFETIQQPLLILRGRESDTLPLESARQMVERHPDAQLVEFEGVGHAPMLMADDQIAAVQDWLKRTAPKA